jgi:hypothetical protein
MAHRRAHVFRRLEVVNDVHFSQGKLTGKVFLDKPSFKTQVFDAYVEVRVDLIQENYFASWYYQSDFKCV